MALTASQVARLAYQTGFRGNALVSVVAIAGRESGYDPSAYNGNVNTGDNSVGLMQINTIGSMGPYIGGILNQLGYQINPNDQGAVIHLLTDPAINLAVAYQMSNGGTSFYPWGGYKGMDPLYATDVPSAAAAVQAAGLPTDGATDVGQHFSGSVGDSVQINGGGSGDGQMPSSDWYARYSQVAPEFNALDAKYQMLSDGQAIWDPDRNAWVVGAQTQNVQGIDTSTGMPTTTTTTQIVPGTGTVVMTGDEYTRYQQLLPQYNELIDEYQKQQAGTSLSDQIAGLNFEHESDPRTIDAKNSADAYARQMDIRNEATSLANQAYSQQPEEQAAASKSFNDFLQSSLPGSFGVPSSNLPTQDELFQKAVATVSKGLPEVKGEPYYDNRTIVPPNSLPTLSDYDSRLGIGGYGSSSTPPPSTTPFGNGAGVGGGQVAGPLQKKPTSPPFLNQIIPPSVQSTIERANHIVAPSASTTLGASSVPGMTQLTGPNPTNSPFLPGYQPPAIAGSVVAKRTAAPNPLIGRLMGGSLEF